LPGDAESILKPAATAFAAAGGEVCPVIVDLLLGVATDDEGDRFIELEEWAAVECGEFCPSSSKAMVRAGLFGLLSEPSRRREFLKTER